LRVAAQAAQLAVQARAEIAQEQGAESESPLTNDNDAEDPLDTSIASRSSDDDTVPRSITEQQAQIIADSSIAPNDAAEAILDLIA